MSDAVTVFQKKFRKACESQEWNSNFKQKWHSQFKKDIYTDALHILDGSYSREDKETILLLMLFFFQDDADLYYRMGCLTKGISVEKEIMWHRFAYDKNPMHIDNTRRLCMLLFENNMGIYTEELNKNGTLFEELKLTGDIDFMIHYLGTVFEYKILNGKLRYVQSILELESRTNELAVHYRLLIYSKCANIFLALGEIESAVNVNEKKIKVLQEGMNMYRYGPKTSEYVDWCRRNMFLCIIHHSTILDYTYYNHIERFNLSSTLNDICPVRPIFSLTSRGIYRPPTKIRVGYVSSDFSFHAVANFICPILQCHDRTRFDIVLFSNVNTKKHMLLPGCRQSKFKIVDIEHMSDEDAARAIYNENIDILIDLNGKTEGNRLTIFTYHPAPVQITYLGYPNTTSLKSMHYRLTDAIADHPESKQIYSEKLVYLPDGFLLFKPMFQETPSQPRATPMGNSEDTIVLGAINREAKNTPPCLEVWRRILHACDNVQLYIQLSSHGDNTEERMEYYMKKLKVSRNRLILSPILSDEGYNKLFEKVDLVLDTFPYSGTTTTCYSLYNSIPVVTMYHKDYHAHNVSSSILTRAGFPELIATDGDHYVEIVKRLVKNPYLIDNYKKTIHAGFARSMEPTRFMKGYEDALISCLSPEK